MGKKYVIVRKKRKSKHHHHHSISDEEPPQKSKKSIPDPPPLPVPDITPILMPEQENTQATTPAKLTIYTSKEPTTPLVTPRRIIHRGPRTLDPDEMTQSTRKYNSLFETDKNDLSDSSDDFFSRSFGPKSPLLPRSNSREVFQLDQMPMTPRRALNDSLKTGLLNPIPLDISDSDTLTEDTFTLTTDTETFTEDTDTMTLSDEPNSTASEKKTRKKKYRKKLVKKRKKSKHEDEEAKTLDEPEINIVIPPEPEIKTENSQRDDDSKKHKKHRKKKRKRPNTIDPADLPSSPRKKAFKAAGGEPLETMCFILDFPSEEELAPFEQSIREARKAAIVNNTKTPERVKERENFKPKYSNPVQFVTNDHEWKCEKPPNLKPPPLPPPVSPRFLIAGPHVHFDFEDIPVHVPHIRRRRTRRW